MVVRRHSPLLFVVVAGICLSAHLVVFADFSIFFVVTGVIAVETTQSRLEAPWRWVGLVLELAGAAVAATRAHELIGDQVHAGSGRLILLTNAWLLVSVAAFVGSARRRSRDRYNQAFERAAVLEAQQATERRLAVIETQQRIARDVHDLLGHSLTVIAMQAEGARAILATDPVDVLLLDVQMPGLDGLAATRELMARGTTGRVVILTTFDTDGYVMGAIEAGAAGFLLKNTPPQDLIAAIRTVHDGDSVISPGPTRRLLTAVRTGQVSGRRVGDGGGRHASEDSVEAVRVAEASQRVAALTQREREILALIAMGLTNQEICDREWLSMPTVKTHVSHLLSKTGCRDRVQLVLLALRGGVVDPDDVLGGG